jgi:hypothetical protein
MRFGINQNPKGAWFPYFGSKINDDGSVEYFFPETSGDKVFINPPLPVEELEKIYAQTRTRKSEFVLNPATRQMERVSYIDQTPEQARKEISMIFCAVVGDFDLSDGEGGKIPCTDENKLKLMKNAEFARFVKRCLELLELSEADRIKALEKN